MNRSFRLFATIVVVVALLALPYRAFAAGPWYVDGTVGNDANACTAPGLSACRTIQAAVNKASTGDTIYVASGTYPELAPGPLTIDKTLTLLGAQAGTDARGRVAMESTVTDSQGTWIRADKVVIDGFTIRDSSNAAFTGFGVWMGGYSGTQILNDIFTNNIVGIGLSNQPSGPQVLIKHNQLEANNLPGGATGSGIYTDQFVSLGAVKNVLITENAFIGNANAGIDISNTDPANGVSGLDISTNSFAGNGRGVLLFNTHMSSIHDNRITNSTTALSGAIRVFDNNSDISILHNDLIGGAGNAIRIGDINAIEPNNPNPSSNIVIHYNNIEVFANNGLLVDVNGHVGTVNAECNWWNSSSGPFNVPDNPTGTGEEVVGDADFTPWLTAPAPNGPCNGTGVPTPGKVTGGGQIESDPVFSALGDLLSIPALIPSLSDPTAQASFGFVVKCCAPTGNLEYNDHQAGVRIKATSIDGLFISSPGTSCPATPGSRHARFTGMASVIRATGTTTERFTVQVDDCGEPGSADTFGIDAETYDNGPSTLISGNIQIH